MPIKEIIEPVDCLITFGDGQKYPAVTFETYIIELAKYIPYLMEEMYKTKRLTIQKMTLNSLEDVMKLNKKHIFNCLGLLSNNIFPDPNLNKGIKGHLLKFELDRYPQVSDFVLFFKTSNQRWILQIPHVQTNKLVLGISYE